MSAHHTTQRPAAVLVLALMLMGAMIGSAISLSTVIADSNHQTTSLNQFIEASLAADNGLEQSLAVVKAGRVNQTVDATKTAITNLGGTVNDAAASDSLVIPKLRPGESYSFDMITPASAITNTIDSLYITAQCVTTIGCSNAGAGYTLSWIGLDSSIQPKYSGRTLNPITFNGTSSSTSTTSLISGQLFNMSGVETTDSSAYGFRVRITAKTLPASVNATADDLAIQNIVVKPCKSTQCPTASAADIFSSRLRISSTGTSGASTSTKTVTLPWQPSASGVFNYVIFSEGAIDKTN